MFFDEIDKSNKLIKAVHHDLSVLGYRVGCKALGLIHKLVTGPLWRKLSAEKTALDMTSHYQHMVECFTKWCNNCDAFLKGEESLFKDLVHKDDLYHSLIKPFEQDEAMVKPLLEIIFSGFLSVSNRMLHDHLHGEYKNPSAEVSVESASVPTTNAASERDFGMLDRLMKLKPKALDLVYEGMITVSYTHLTLPTIYSV